MCWGAVGADGDTMKTKRIMALVLAAVLAVSAVAVAGQHLPEQANDDADDDGPSDASTYGRCTAYEANENGREHGNAGNAPPFQALQDDAEAENETVEEHCEDIEPPAEDGTDDGDEGNATAEEAEEPEDADEPEDESEPDDAGKPEHAGGPDDAEDDG